LWLQRELQPFTTDCLSPLRGFPLTRQLRPTTTNERRADSVFDSESDGETGTDRENFPKKASPRTGL
jgi:hypothetical protein